MDWRMCRRGFFFFQAEDGIRDGTVTAVQTCALPILVDLPAEIELSHRGRLIRQAVAPKRFFADLANADPLQARRRTSKIPADQLMVESNRFKDRSEERRVGKECRRRG